jgi:hypothetical protein
VVSIFCCQNCDLVCRQFFLSGFLMTLLQVLFWSHALCSAVILYFVLQALFIVSCRLLHCVLQSCIVSCSRHALCSVAIMHCVLQELFIVSCNIADCVLQSLCIVLCSHYALCCAVTHCVLQPLWIMFGCHKLCSAFIMSYVLQA